MKTTRLSTLAARLLSAVPGVIFSPSRPAHQPQPFDAIAFARQHRPELINGDSEWLWYHCDTIVYASRLCNLGWASFEETRPEFRSH